jgi:peptide/nickel transport system permease protein
VLTYILKRVLLMVPTLIGITIVVFGISRMAPGDPVSASFGAQSMGASVAGGSADLQAMQRAMDRKRAKLGLDKPLVTQYRDWVTDFFSGDFGHSTKYEAPVAEKLEPALWITLKLNAISLLLIYLIAVPLGVHAAIRRGEPDERAAGLTLFALYSAPSFWVATLMLFYFCNPSEWYWFEGEGLHSQNYLALPYMAQIRDTLAHLVLPVICLTYNGLASLSRFARTGMLEIIRMDYIRTARAKGLPERTVILKHALRNSLIPIVTLMASLLPAMIGGSVIIEFIFNINGMGKLGFEAILSRDYDMVMAITTLSAVLVLLGILTSDLLYTVVDPRISLEG